MTIQAFQLPDPKCLGRRHHNRLKVQFDRWIFQPRHTRCRLCRLQDWAVGSLENLARQRSQVGQVRAAYA